MVWWTQRPRLAPWKGRAPPASPGDSRKLSCFHEWETCCTFRDGLQHWPPVSHNGCEKLHPAYAGIWNFFKDFFFYVHQHFACMSVCVRMPDPLELELQAGCWELSPGLNHWAIIPAPVFEILYDINQLQSVSLCLTSSGGRALASFHQASSVGTG